MNHDEKYCVAFKKYSEVLKSTFKYSNVLESIEKYSTDWISNSVFLILQYDWSGHMLGDK